MKNGFGIVGVFKTAGLSKNQRMILKFLEVKPEMTTKELAELVFSKPIDYKTKEYSSISRSLHSLERRGLIKRVHIQLRWKLSSDYSVDKKKKKEGWIGSITTLQNQT